MKYRVLLSSLLAVILVANVALVGLTPTPTQAAVKSTVAAFGGCFAGGVLTQAVKNLIDTGIQNAIDAVSQMEDGALKSFLGGFLSDFGLGSVPTSDSGAAKAAQANFAAFTNAQTRNAILERCTALAIMTNMTNNILTVVRTGGRDGGPTYVTNWANFQTNSQYRGENIFRAELSTANLCPYLSNDVKKSFGVDPKTKTPLTGQNTRTDSLQPFSLSTSCTMPAGFTMQKYQQDFAGNGGWDTFARMLEPQNNIMGLTALSLQEAQKQRALAEQADVNQVLANNGYTGVSGVSKADSCQIMGPTGMCLTYKDIKTTGNYLAQNVGATIGAQFAWLTSAQGLNTIISDATEVMLNRLLDFGSSDDGNYHPANDTGAAYTVPTAVPVPQPVCTANGQAEQSFMLPLLNASTAPQSVADQTNTKFSLTTGNQAVYYSDSNTIGLPEFYVAGVPSGVNGAIVWNIVSRCTGSAGSGATGGGAGGSGGGVGNPAI